MIRKLWLLGMYGIGLVLPLVIAYNKFAVSATKTSLPVWALVSIGVIGLVMIKFAADSFTDWAYSNKIIVLMFVLLGGLVSTYKVTKLLESGDLILSTGFGWLILTTAIAAFCGAMAFKPSLN